MGFGFGFGGASWIGMGSGFAIEIGVSWIGLLGIGTDSVKWIGSGCRVGFIGVSE